MTGYSPTERMKIFPYDPRFRPIAPPETGIFDEPRVSICINVKWMAHIDGVIDRLMWLDAWAGSQEDKERAVGEITKLVGAIALREACGDDMACCDDLKAQLQAMERVILQGQIQQQEATAKAIRDAFLEKWIEGGGLGETPTDGYLAVNDGGPSEKWDGIDGDYDSALCRGITAFVYLWAQGKINQLRIEAIALYGASLLIPLTLLPGLSYFLLAGAGIGLGVGWEIEALTLADVIAALTDTDALDNVICHIVQGLTGADLGSSAFSAASDPEYWTEGSHEAIIASMLDETVMADNELVGYDFIAQAKQMEAFGSLPLINCPCDDGPIDEPAFTFTQYPGGLFVNSIIEFVEMDGEDFVYRLTSGWTGYQWSFLANGNYEFTIVSLTVEDGPIDAYEADLVGKTEATVDDAPLTTLGFYTNSKVGPGTILITAHVEFPPTWSVFTDFPAGHITAQTETSVNATSDEAFGTERIYLYKTDVSAFTVATIDVTGTVNNFLWVDGDDENRNEPIETGDIVKQILYEGTSGEFSIAVTI
jgi:hypothetical protein